MVIYRWEKELETGIALVDKQHVQLLIAINKLLIRRKCKNDRDGIEEYIRYIGHHLQYHFQTEEAYQVECQYEKFREHQAQHNFLATQLRFLIVNLEGSDYEDRVVEEFYTFLSGWISNHLLQEDVHFAQAYRAYQGEKKANKNPH